jgi:hypothetical protein
MAPTIGRQWRGGTQDYAALCDYCDVRYLRSQLKNQANGRLACIGPGTNSCGAGHDEVTLDKVNADKMRHRRKPTKHLGGRFDRVLSSVGDIFGASLVEFWDATEGVLAATGGKLTSWTGQKLGATFTADAVFGQGTFYPSRPEFYDRPGIAIDGGPQTGALWTATGNFIPSGGRPYLGMVSFSHNDSQYFAGSNGVVSFSSGAVEGALGRSVASQEYRGFYRSALNPAGTELAIPEGALGSVRKARLYELDATGPLSFRAGGTTLSTTLDSPTLNPWQVGVLFPAMTLTLLVLCNAPEPGQVRRFQALARSYAVERP